MICSSYWGTYTEMHGHDESYSPYKMGMVLKKPCCYCQHKHALKSVVKCAYLKVLYMLGRYCQRYQYKCTCYIFNSFAFLYQPVSLYYYVNLLEICERWCYRIFNTLLRKTLHLASRYTVKEELRKGVRWCPSWYQKVKYIPTHLHYMQCHLLQNDGEL